MTPTLPDEARLDGAAAGRGGSSSVLCPERGTSAAKGLRTGEAASLDGPHRGHARSARPLLRRRVRGRGKPPFWVNPSCDSSVRIVFSTDGSPHIPIWPLLLLVPLLWFMRCGVVAREERYVGAKFGGDVPDLPEPRASLAVGSIDARAPFGGAVPSPAAARRASYPGHTRPLLRPPRMTPFLRRGCASVMVVRLADRLT
jgi:hypothetical protein